jgi:hypothetical protein
LPAGVSHPGATAAAGAVDEASREPSLASQTRFHSRHGALVPPILVIEAEQMEEAMQREDPQLRAQRMAHFDRLPPRNPCRDHDIPEETLLVGWK